MSATWSSKDSSEISLQSVSWGTETMGRKQNENFHLGDKRLGSICGHLRTASPQLAMAKLLVKRPHCKQDKAVMNSFKWLTLCLEVSSSTTNMHQVLNQEHAQAQAKLQEAGFEALQPPQVSCLWMGEPELQSMAMTLKSRAETSVFLHSSRHDSKFMSNSKWQYFLNQSKEQVFTIQNHRWTLYSDEAAARWVWLKKDSHPCRSRLENVILKKKQFASTSGSVSAPLPFFMRIQKMQFRVKRKNCKLGRAENSKGQSSFYTNQPLPSFSWAKELKNTLHLHLL